MTDRELLPWPWRPMNLAPQIHQDYMLGYSPEIGTYAMHWRDDKGGWCYTWNQEPCNPVAWARIPGGLAQ